MAGETACPTLAPVIDLLWWRRRFRLRLAQSTASKGTIMKRLLFFFVLAALPSVATAANLIIDNAWDHAPVIAYELPDTGGRAEAIRYVESIRDQFKKGTVLLDVAANRSSLKDKLKNGFVLYTTLGEKSELLRLATRKLGWEITGSSFHWRDLTAPAGELRVILVGKNPYSKGFCVIYAAGSNRALAGINGLPHGSASYHVFQGSQLLREGRYDENFTSIEHVSKAAALEDASQFFQTLKRVHPDLLARVSKDGYRKLEQQTADSIASKVDSSGEIPAPELASSLYYAAAYFEDGHTSVNWGTSLNEVNTRGKRFPAFRLLFDNGRFVIAAAKDGTIVDTELVSVNGAPVLEFLRPILDRCSGETLGFRAARFLWNEPFWYYMTNLFGSGDYTLRVRDAQGEYREAALETLNYAEYQAFRKQGGAEPFRPNGQGTRVEFLDSGATAHFMYSSFYSGAAEKKKIDSVFQEVKARGARNLILDIRGNLGGESGMAEYIFRYLYDGKFRSLSKVRAKASWEILPQVPWWARPLIVVLNGHVVSHSIAERRVPKPAAFFSGPVYLLVDNGSFSMAAEFAAMFRDYKVGTIVGYETGGLPDTFGGPHFFTLKNSRIPCSVSWTENLPPSPQPGDKEHGVVPAVPLSVQKLADFKSERDPVLAFTLRYVSDRASAPPRTSPSATVASLAGNPRP
jgi:hypothetical protein